MRTALVIGVPEAEPVIGHIRPRYDRAGALGVPAHVTVLFPFGEDPDGLEELFAEVEPFDFALVRTAWFDPPVLYLAPEPAKPFIALIETVYARYPDFGGTHGAIVPHVTVGKAVPEDDERQIQAALPIRARAESVTWLEERADGRWAERRRFALGARRSGS